MNKIKIGDLLKCEVIGIANYGLFVKPCKNEKYNNIEEYNGLIHISEISNKYIKDIKKMFVIGDTVNAKVLGIDEENNRLVLSIKNTKNVKKDHIEERGEGFEPLKEKLEMWVSEMINDVKNTKKGGKK